MNKRRLVVLVMILIVYLTGCTDGQSADDTGDIEKSISELQAELDTYKQNAEDMIATLETLNSELLIDNNELSAEKTALQNDILVLNNSILELEEDLSTLTINNDSAEEYILELVASLTLLTKDYDALLLELEDVPIVDSFIHINGHGYEVKYYYSIMFEWQLRDYVRYQISYLSCDCRNPDVNYHQVAIVEINRITNDIRFISFDLDSTGYYSPGVWGDSNPMPSGKTLEDFEADFIPWLIGKTTSNLEGISVFTNAEYFGILNTTTIPEQDLIDSFAGSSVTTNNMIRVMKELLEYHEENHN